VAIRETSDAALISDTMMISTRLCPSSSLVRGKKEKSSFVTPRTKRTRKSRVRRTTVSTLLSEYESILNQSPMLVKSLTSLFGFGVADVVAQGLSTSTNTDSRSSPIFDGARTLRFAAFGFFLYGPTSSVWYSSLDTYILPENPTSGLAVASKVFADQVLWAPVLISSLFAFDLAFDTSGTTKPTLSKKIENDLFSALKVNWSFWPMFHLFSFRFVPTEDRILYINCVQVLFNVFLVYTSSKREEGKGDKDSI
jgi:protein Mpv17